ncbi:TPA: hypothetical protein ACGUUY_003588 [Vibrio vulnificus]|nr:hypothetical protein [Vibrio vulnificus]
MSELEKDIQKMIEEKLKTATATNNSFRGAAGRALKRGVAEPMTVYRTNKRDIENQIAKYAQGDEADKNENTNSSDDVVNK